MERHRPHSPINIEHVRRFLRLKGSIADIDNSGINGAPNHGGVTDISRARRFGSSIASREFPLSSNGSDPPPETETFEFDQPPKNAA